MICSIQIANSGSFDTGQMGRLRACANELVQTAARPTAACISLHKAWPASDGCLHWEVRAGGVAEAAAGAAQAGGLIHGEPVIAVILHCKHHELLK